MYDTIIVGGGISGLYCAIHLVNVLVLEESNQWGGKIHKHYHPHFYGAGRFHKNHILLWNLIQRFKLTIQKLSNNDDSAKAIYDRCLPVLGESDALHFVYAEGFHEMYYRNKQEGQDDYYYIKEGLKELCHRMLKEIKGKGKCVLNHSVKTITPLHDRIKVDGYEGKRVIVAIPPERFKCFPLLTYHSTSIPSLLRIYAKYSIAWFESIKSIRLFPMHDSIVLILYVKEDILKFTMNHHLFMEQKLRQILQQELSTEFPDIHIPEPLWIKPYLWTTDWKTDWILNQEVKCVWVCGDACSNRPDWIEGALETAETALQAIQKDV